MVTYDGWMPPDATHTKRRILDAARAEFALNGLAGARVDRIAENASANKRSIYVHFGAKEELFDIVVGQGLLELADAIPFDAAALPEYAGHLFDLLQAKPDIARLTSWAVLERPQPIVAEVDAYRTKIQAIRDAQERGEIHRDHDPVVLMTMIISLVTGWSSASWSLRSLTGTDAATPPPGFRQQLTRAIAVMTRVF